MSAHLASRKRARNLRSLPGSSGGSLAFDTLGGALGAVVAAATTSEKKALVIGGIDLTDVDVSRPFSADFSVPRDAPSHLKYRAFGRLKHGQAQLSMAFPGWTFSTDVSPRDGKFVLYVSPISDPRFLVARTVLEP
jgi:hypothetical protein